MQISKFCVVFLPNPNYKLFQIQTQIAQTEIKEPEVEDFLSADQSAHNPFQCNAQQSWAMPWTSEMLLKGLQKKYSRRGERWDKKAREGKTKWKHSG